MKRRRNRSPRDVFDEAMRAPPMTAREIRNYQRAQAAEMARAEAKRAAQRTQETQ